MNVGGNSAKTTKGGTINGCKKYQEAASKVDRTQYYSVEEAIKLAKEN